MCRFNYGLDVWAYGNNPTNDNDKFLVGSFNSAEFFSRSLTGIVQDLRINYRKFILNKALVVVDQIVMNVWYQMNTGDFIAEPNLNKHYIRVKWLDRPYNDRPLLHMRSSEAMRDYQYKLFKNLRLKHYYYPQCKYAIPTTETNLKKSFQDMVSEMGGKASFSPCIYTGWGPYVGYPTSGMSMRVEIAFRFRVYGYFTFCGKIADSNVSSESTGTNKPDVRVSLEPQVVVVRKQLDNVTQ